MSNLTIDINGYCNEDCRFCYQNLDGSSLSDEEIFRIVDENPNIKTVEIGGGEPFLDTRIIEFIKNLRAKGRNVHISTNATLIPKGFLDLEDSVRKGVQVQISIHGSDPDIYYKIHKRNLFDRVIDNTRKIKPLFNTIMTSAIYQENFDDVPNLVKLTSELNLPLRVNLVFPVGKGKDVQRLNSQQIDQLRGYLLSQTLSENNKIDSPLIHQNNCYALAQTYGIEREGVCPFDCGKIYVSPRGERKNCEFYAGDKNE